MSAQDLTPSIATNGQSPQSVTSDGLSVTARPIADQILANNYLAAVAAAAAKSRGVRFSRIRLARQVPFRGPVGGECFDGPGSFQ